MTDRDSLPPSCDTVTDLQQISDHRHQSPLAVEHRLTPTSPLIMVPSFVQASPASPFMDDASTDDDMETYISPEHKSGNDFVPRKGTTLREFVIKYEHALEHRYRAEHVEWFASIYKKPILSIKSPLEEHAADVYARSIFNQF